MYDINIARETCYHISIRSAKLSNEVEETTEYYTTRNNEFKYSNNFLSNLLRCGISYLIFVSNWNDLFIYFSFYYDTRTGQWCGVRFEIRYSNINKFKRNKSTSLKYFN